MISKMWTLSKLNYIVGEHTTTKTNNFKYNIHIFTMEMGKQEDEKWFRYAICLCTQTHNHSIKNNGTLEIKERQRDTQRETDWQTKVSNHSFMLLNILKRDSILCQSEVNYKYKQAQNLISIKKINNVDEKENMCAPNWLCLLNWFCI